MARIDGSNALGALVMIGVLVTVFLAIGAPPWIPVVMAVLLLWLLWPALLVKPPRRPTPDEHYREALAGARHALEHGLPTGPWVVFLAFWGPLAGQEPYPDLDRRVPERVAQERAELDRKLAKLKEDQRRAQRLSGRAAAWDPGSAAAYRRIERDVAAQVRATQRAIGDVPLRVTAIPERGGLTCPSCHRANRKLYGELGQCWTCFSDLRS